MVLDKYPAVPKPTTVDPICVARYDVLTSPVRFAVDTRLARFAVDTKPYPPIFVSAVDRYPAVPKPVTVEVS